jgi:hypothetical protein
MGHLLSQLRFPCPCFRALTRTQPTTTFKQLHVRRRMRQGSHRNCPQRDLTVLRYLPTPQACVHPRSRRKLRRRKDEVILLLAARRLRLRLCEDCLDLLQLLEALSLRREHEIVIVHSEGTSGQIRLEPGVLDDVLDREAGVRGRNEDLAQQILHEVRFNDGMVSCGSNTLANRRMAQRRIDTAYERSSIAQDHACVSRLLEWNSWLNMKARGINSTLQSAETSTRLGSL